MQEGTWRLKELRLDGVKSNPDAYIRQAVKFAMIDHLRKLHQDKYVSFLEAHKMGYQWNEEGQLVAY